MLTGLFSFLSRHASTLRLLSIPYLEPSNTTHKFSDAVSDLRLDSLRCTPDFAGYLANICGLTTEGVKDLHLDYLGRYSWLGFDEVLHGPQLSFRIQEYSNVTKLTLHFPPYYMHEWLKVISRLFPKLEELELDFCTSGLESFVSPFQWHITHPDFLRTAKHLRRIVMRNVYIDQEKDGKDVYRINREGLEFSVELEDKEQRQGCNFGYVDRPDSYWSKYY